MVIDGDGLVTVKANNHRIFTLAGSSSEAIDVAIQEITLIDGNTTTIGADPYHGGTIYSKNANLHLNQVDILNSTSPDRGGAIYVESQLAQGTNLKIENSQIDGSRAQMGGAVYAQNATLDVTNSKVLNSTAALSGGGIAVFDGSNVEITGSKFANNHTCLALDGTEVTSCSANGGAIALTDMKSNVQTSISGVFFEGNSTKGGDGGALFYGYEIAATGNTGGSFSIDDVVFYGNTAFHNGGGLYLEADGVDTSVIGSVFANNTAGVDIVGGPPSLPIEGSGGGAAIEVDNADIFVGSKTVSHLDVKTTFNNNIAKGSTPFEFNCDQTFTPRFGGGGGLLVDGRNSRIEIDGVTLDGNQATFGGADEEYLHNCGSGIFLAETRYTNGDGGGMALNVYLDQPSGSSVETIQVSNVVARANESAGQGGGAFIMTSEPLGLAGGDVRVKDSTFDGNDALLGGGLYGLVSTDEDSVIETSNLFTVQDSTFSRNTAASHGGGAFLCAKFTGRAQIGNSTFSNNTAGEQGGGLALAIAVEVEDMTAGLTNVTITENQAVQGTGLVISPDETGRGLENFGDLNVSMDNSIVAGNRLLLGVLGGDVYVGNIKNSDPAVDDNQFESGAYNLLGEVSEVFCSTCNAGLDPSTNFFLTDPILNPSGDLDPKLSPLGDFGGKTETHLPLVDSPAIDEGRGSTTMRFESSAPVYDQRGNAFPRTLGLFPDIGATELSKFVKVVDIEILSSQGGITYDVPTGSTEQVRTVPLGSTARAIRVAFNRPVNIATSDITIANATPESESGAAVPAYECKRLLEADTCQHGNGGTFWAIVEFEENLGLGDWSITIDDAVNFAGQRLDGEWYNPMLSGGTTTCPSGGCSDMPSGNDVDEGDFLFYFTIIPGDFNRDQTADFGDHLLLSGNFGESFRQFVHGDADLNGIIEFADFLTLSGVFGKQSQWQFS